VFFDRSGPTREIWFYEHPLPEGRKNYTKTQPLQYEEFAGCLDWWSNRKENDQAWKVSAEQVLKYDGEGRLLSANLDLKNPRAKQDFEYLPPEQLIESIVSKENRILEILNQIKLALTGEVE
jgi:type I restriction enzyme M protein